MNQGFGAHLTSKSKVFQTRICDTTEKLFFASFHTFLRQLNTFVHIL